MSRPPQSQRYSTIAIALHWLIALLILGQIAGGYIMVELVSTGSSLQFSLFQWHKSFGITILLLSLVRLGWRLTHRPPPLPEDMSGWERLVARLTHIAFYVAMIALPLLGWAVVSSSPYAASVPTMIFGLIPLPHLPFFAGSADPASVNDLLSGLHGWLAYGTLALVVLHVAAALKHHFVERDGVLARMLPAAAREGAS